MNVIPNALQTVGPAAAAPAAATPAGDIIEAINPFVVAIRPFFAAITGAYSPIAGIVLAAVGGCSLCRSSAFRRTRRASPHC